MQRRKKTKEACTGCDSRTGEKAKKEGEAPGRGAL